MRVFINYLIAILVTMQSVSCGTEYLDIKRDKSQLVPVDISDYLGMIDNATMMTTNSSHQLGIIGADEFFVSDASWNALTVPMQKNAYIWANEVYEAQPVSDWNNAYQRIFYANMVLDGLSRIEATDDKEQQDWRMAYGSALFYRAYNYYQLAQLFCKPFELTTADTDLGLPLRLESDITTRAARSTVRQTYEQIIVDLEQAIQYLPNSSITVYRPSGRAVHALLAKTYLLIAEYEKALLHASECLLISNSLIDYNDLNIESQFAHTVDYDQNSEIILMTNTANLAIYSLGNLNVNPALLELYNVGDLRREINYKIKSDGNYSFNGSLMGLPQFFTGLSLSEILLIRSEAAVRTGQLNIALNDILYLWQHRYTNEAYGHLVDWIGTGEELLKIIITERQKELAFMGVRWEDLRRLNKDSRFSRTLIRYINNVEFELLPNGKKYVWPIPQESIRLGGLDQNDR